MWEYITVGQNAFFMGAIVIAAVYCVCSAVFGSDHEASDVGHDHDMDCGHDVDHDFDMGHDVDHDADHGDIHGHGFVNSALNWVGVGRCPLSVILTILLISFGFIGLCGNGLFSKVLPLSVAFFPSLAMATVLSLFLTRAASRPLAKLVPKTESNTVTLASLVESIGTASVSIDEKYGRVRLYDKFGALHNVDCRVQRGKSLINEGEEVLLLTFIKNEKMFIVAPAPKLPQKQG